MVDPLTAGVPTSPLVDNTGHLHPAWRRFFVSLYLRTGGAQGLATPDIAIVDAAIAAEETARIAADQAQTAATNSGDAANATAISNETAARITADAALVPIASLGSVFAATNLSGLPTTNPGGGKPWLWAGNVHVGP